MLTPYPQIVEYNEAVQHPATAFRDPELRQGRVEVNRLGLPVALSGGFALTYVMTTPRRKLAVRCFHRAIPAAEHKYKAIARAVSRLRSPHFVGFEFLPDGIGIRGGHYPVVKMDWAEGDPLGIWLDRNAGDRRALEKLREEFAVLAAFLERHGIAHGDIQNGNVIVSASGLKLVDYDGVYVPGMPAEFGTETGHRHFQHPRRTTAHFGPAIDRFSFIAVDLSLAALIEDPRLHRRFRQGGETILFRAADFADPDRSEAFGLLRRRPALREATERFAAVCRGEFAAVPSLAEFRAESVPGSPSSRREAAPVRFAQRLWSGLTGIGAAAAKPPDSDTVAAPATPSPPPRLEPAIGRPAAPPLPAAAGGPNRRLVARLLGGEDAPASGPLPPSDRVAAPPRAGDWRPRRSNRDILRALRPGAAAAPAAAPPSAAPAINVPNPAPVRAPMPRSGSVVIHPRTPGTPASRPPAPEAGAPGWLHRALRAIGIEN